MRLNHNGFWTAGALAALVVGLSAQAPAPPPQQEAEKPTFKVQIDLVTNDVIVRDAAGNFVPDLKKEDFAIYEDGVKQDITSMTVVHGGRVTNVLAPPPPPPPEGIILPPPKPVVNDTSGRIFLFFVDDMHLEFENTPRIRVLFKKIAKDLLHEGDMWGMVSSGPSSLAYDMTYNRSLFEAAINKISGHELTPTEIIQGPTGSEGPSEVRYRAHVAFSTVEDILRQLEQIHNRRKALIYVSDGYDFNPYTNSRFGINPSFAPGQPPFQQNANAAVSELGQTPGAPLNDALNRQAQTQEQFADADLARELADLTDAANRANTTIYTLDPRGLVGPLGDISQNVDPTEWQGFIRKSQDSLRVLAEQTGGVAVVNSNDYDKALKRIDAETSDYYVIGYYSKNTDQRKRFRSLEVKVDRKGLTVWARKLYVLKPPPAPPSSSKP
jgi:VWFA-related protein